MLSYNQKLKKERLSLSNPTAQSPAPQPTGISSILNKVSMQVRFIKKKQS